MAKNPAPHNGPSKTGNPSGGGRGNNSPWDDDDDTPSSSSGYRPSYSYRWTDPSFVSPSPGLTPAEHARFVERVVAEAVELITKGTYAGLMRDLLRLEYAYLTPGSPKRQGMTSHAIEQHATAASRARARVEASRLDYFALLLRKARVELSGSDAEGVVAAVRLALTPHAGKLLSQKLNTAESPFSRGIRSRVKIDELQAYLGLSGTKLP